MSVRFMGLLHVCLLGALSLGGCVVEEPSQGESVVIQPVDQGPDVTVDAQIDMMIDAEVDMEPDAEPTDRPVELSTIQLIQQGFIAEGETVSIIGAVVSSPVSGEGFYVSDGSSEPYSGIWIAQTWDAVGEAPFSMGDEVAIEGRVVELEAPAEGEPTTTRTRTAIDVELGEVRQTGEAQLPDAIPVLVTELAVPELAEPYEGVLIALADPSISRVHRGAGEFVVDFISRVSNLFDAFDLSWLARGWRFESITGVLHYGDGLFKVAPRMAEDLVLAAITVGDCVPVDGYGLCMEGLNWGRARDACASKGGRLVVAETEEENQALGQIMKLWHEGSFYVSLNDRSDEGVFVWIDGSELEYDRWDESEPNDYGNGEDCTESNWKGQIGLWNDVNCGQARAYVCEFPGEGARCDDDCPDGVPCIDGSCRRPEPEPEPEPEPRPFQYPACETHEDCRAEHFCSMECLREPCVEGDGPWCQPCEECQEPENSVNGSCEVCP